MHIKVGDFGLVTDSTPGGSFGSMEDGQRTPYDERCMPWCGAAGDTAVLAAVDRLCCQEQRHTANVGTRLYMSPEQVRTQYWLLLINIFNSLFYSFKNVVVLMYLVISFRT